MSMLPLPHFRQVVRRQEFLQHQLEKADEVLSAKAEAKNALSKEVSADHASCLQWIAVVFKYAIFAYVGFSTAIFWLFAVAHLW